ncbi:MAG: glycine zipper domain-containing protein [Candidatus Omnitrophota bacterium]|jgi:uncharacterized membrane protein
MKKYASLFVILAFLFVAFGCETNKTRVGEGAGIGGALGAIAGGVIGNQTGSPVGGALIGGALGAAGGAAIGAQINKPGTTAAGSTQPMAQFSMNEIVELTKQGVASDNIIAKIRATHSTYSLTQDDISYLRRQGVSQRVIEEMLAAK